MRAVVDAIHAWLWLIEAWGVVIVRHAAILIVQVEWRVVALLKGDGALKQVQPRTYWIFFFLFPKGRLAPITGEYCCSTELLSGLLRSEAITTKQWFQPRARTLKS